MSYTEMPVHSQVFIWTLILNITIYAGYFRYVILMIFKFGNHWLLLNYILNTWQQDIYLFLTDYVTPIENKWLYILIYYLVITDSLISINIFLLLYKMKSSYISNNLIDLTLNVGGIWFLFNYCMIQFITQNGTL